MKAKRLVPNVIRGGQAVPLGNNFYYMNGRKHSQGGIDVGKDLEVEGGEVMQISNKDTKVYSSVRFLGGKSPAELVMAGANPNKVFNAQERFKKVNKINDDGTRKAQWGTKLNRKEEAAFQGWYAGESKSRNIDRNPDSIGQDYDYRGYWKDVASKEPKILNGGSGHFTDKYKTPNHPTFSDESQYSSPLFQGGSWTEDKTGRSIYIPSRYTKGRKKATINYLKGSGEGYNDNNKIIFP